jgi:hypothetical protein
MVNGETVAIQWLSVDCRGSDSNVELNDMQGNETSSPLHT